MKRSYHALVVIVLVVSMALSSSAASWKLMSNGSYNIGFVDNTWVSLDDGETTSMTVSSNDDYVVTDNRTIYSGTNDKAIFTGKSLTIGDLASGKTGTLAQYYSKVVSGTNDVTVLNDGLILARGSWYTRYGNASQPYPIYGKITVKAPEGTPFVIYRHNSSANALQVMDAFSGDGWIQVSTGSELAPRMTLALLGEYGDFSGGIRLVTATATDGSVTGVGRLAVTNGTCSATVRAATGCRIAATDAGVTAGFGSFDLADGAVLEFSAKGVGTTGTTRALANSKYVLSSGLTISGKAKIEITFDDAASGKFNDTFDLLTVPATVTLDKDDFEFVPTEATHPEANFSVRDDGATKTLVITYVGSGAELLTQAENGTNAKGLTGVKWSDGSTGTSADYRYATVGYSIYISTSSDTLNRFYGQSLRIGDAEAGTAGYLRHYGGKPAVDGHEVPDFPNDGLILACGAWAPRYGSAYLASGKVTVTAKESSPFRFYNEYSSEVGGSSTKGSLTLLGPLSGSGAVQVDAGVISKASSTNFCLRLMGGAADFTGTIAVTSQVSNTGFDCHAGLAVTNGVIPAAVSVGHGSYLAGPSAGDTATLKTLALDGGSELSLTAGQVDGVLKAGKIGVTDACTVRGTATINLEVGDDYAAGGTLELLTVPVSSAVTAADFTLSTDIPTFYVPTQVLTFREDEGGAMKTLVLTIPEVTFVTMTGNDTNRSPMTNTVADTSFTNVLSWSDGELPHAGAHYVCQALSDQERGLRTPTEMIDYVFPGESLALVGSSGGKAAVLLILYDSFTIPQLLAKGNAAIQPKYSHGGVVLKTTLTAEDGQLNIQPYAGALFRHEGELKGNSTIRVYGNGGSGNPGGYVEFTGTNTSFSGVFDFFISAGNGAPSIGYGLNGQRRFESVYVSDGRNLGGAMSPANPKGVILRDCSMVITRNSVTFDEPTRGWYIGSTGQVNVASADHELVLKNPLALNGTLYKLGPGRLTLANPQPTFGSAGTATTPDSDAVKRTLIVTNGAVKIASADAVNGLDLFFDSAETKLVLDAETTDEDLAETGFIDTLTPGTPLDVNTEAGAEKVRLEIECAAHPTWSSKTLGLCTVKEADAASVAQLLNVTRAKGAEVDIVRVYSESVTIGDVACVTFKAELKPRAGLMLLVK